MMSNSKKDQYLALLFAMIIFTGGCATIPQQPLIGSGHDYSLNTICSQHNVIWTWDHTSQVATLQFGGAQAQALVGSAVVLLDQETIHLSSPVKMVNSSVIVPADFKEKVIDWLYNQHIKGKEEYKYLNVRKVIIDAGHGGKDPGAIGLDGLQEKNVVLDIAQRMEKILRKRGVDVVMTRNKDEFLTLEKRTELTSEQKADLFVSIHGNSHPDRNVQGLEVYVAKDMGYAERNEEQRQKNHKILFTNLAINRDSREVQKIVSDMLYVHKQTESRNFSDQLAQDTTLEVNIKNLGRKNSRFFVLRYTLIPAVLVEVGFLTNPKEARLLETAEQREKIARALADSILNYIH